MEQGAILNRLINFANLDDTFQIKSILYETHTLHLLEVRNQREYSLLHLSCYNNNTEITELYLNYIQAQLDSNVINIAAVRNYVNAQNDEGFTALHLASYRGNLVAFNITNQKVVELLESYQADAQIVNYNQMTVLHTAAQGDSVLICVSHRLRSATSSARDFRSMLSTIKGALLYSGHLFRDRLILLHFYYLGEPISTRSIQRVGYQPCIWPPCREIPEQHVNYS